MSTYLDTGEALYRAFRKTWEAADGILIPALNASILAVNADLQERGLDEIAFWEGMGAFNYATGGNGETPHAAVAKLVEATYGGERPDNHLRILSALGHYISLRAHLEARP